MFQAPWLGSTLALAHYIGALAVGLVFRFYGLGDKPSEAPAGPCPSGNIITRAVDRLVEARREDGRPLGQIMGDAVNDSIKTLLMICGFIMLFSTFVRISHIVGLEAILAAPLRWLFRLLGIDPTLVPSALAGVFEIDLGTVAAAGARASLMQRALMASAIIGWSGLSVHSQVASVLAGTDIRMAPYAFARLLHAAVAALATVWLLPKFASSVPAPPLHAPTVIPVLAPAAQAGADWSTMLTTMGEGLLRGTTWAIATLALLLLVGLTGALFVRGRSAHT